MCTVLLGAADAEFLEPELSPELDATGLLNLPNHELYVKLMVDGAVSRPFGGTTLGPLD